MSDLSPMYFVNAAGVQTPVSISSPLPLGNGSQIVVFDTAGNLKVVPLPAKSVAVPAGTLTDTVIKNSSGILFGFLITATGAGNVTFYDNASVSTGTIVGFSTGSSTGQHLGPSNGVQCVNGIVLQGVSGLPAVTVFYF